MKIAVTGHKGFIGSRLVSYLRESGADVSCVNPTDTGKFDRVYHLACPATTERITRDPIQVMDTILDATRLALNICPTALFINTSSMGAMEIDDTTQGGYNAAKRCMEIYISQLNRPATSYRLPAVYGVGMNSDHFIKRCVDGTAISPSFDGPYAIAHVDRVVSAMAALLPVRNTYTSTYEIYSKFTSGEWTLEKDNS